MTAAAPRAGSARTEADVAAGDDAVLCPQQFVSQLMADCSAGLLRQAERLLHDRQMAEDVVQEALLRAWSNAERLHSREGSVRGWLYTVVRNLALDRLASAAHRYESVGTENLEVSQRDHVDAVLAGVESRALLRHLSLQHREVLVHTYLYGRSVQETARLLGIPAGTVKSRQHYALNILRSRARVRAGVWAG